MFVCLFFTLFVGTRMNEKKQSVRHVNCGKREWASFNIDDDDSNNDDDGTTHGGHKQTVKSIKIEKSA